MTISTTRLYDLLSTKVGKETAETLTTYIEEKINDKFEDNTKILSTKEDLYLVKEELKEDISSLKEELKENISSLKEELKENISSLKVEFKKDLSLLKVEFKEDISLLKVELKDDIARVREMAVNNKAEIIKWMFIFWVGQVAVTFGFILLFLKK